MPLIRRRGTSNSFMQMLKDTLNEGIRLSRTDPERAKVMLRKIHRLISDADESEKLAIENNKDDVIRILYDAGSLLFELSDKEKSIDFFEKIKEYNPKLPEPYFQIAKILASQNIQLPYALVNLKRAVELNPKYEDAIVLMGDIYRIQGNIEETIKWYKEAFNISKNRIDILDRILSIDPNDKDALYSKLSYYREKGDKESMASIYLQLAILENKIELIDEGLKISPENIQLLKEKARFLINQKKFSEAEKFLEKVEKLNPGDPELPIIKALMVEKPVTVENIFEDIGIVEQAVILEDLIKNGYDPNEFPFSEDLKNLIPAVKYFVEQKYDDEKLLNAFVSKNQRIAYAWYYKYKIAKIKGNEVAAENFRLMALNLNKNIEKLEM